MMMIKVLSKAMTYFRALYLFEIENQILLLHSFFLGVSLSDIEKVLDQRSLKVRRSAGNPIYPQLPNTELLIPREMPTKKKSGDMAIW